MKWVFPLWAWSIFCVHRSACMRISFHLLAILFHRFATQSFDIFLYHSICDSFWIDSKWNDSLNKLHHYSFTLLIFFHPGVYTLDLLLNVSCICSLYVVPHHLLFSESVLTTLVLSKQHIRACEALLYN